MLVIVAGGRKDMGIDDLVQRREEEITRGNSGGEELGNQRSSPPQAKTVPPDRVPLVQTDGRRSSSSSPRLGKE
ncbi:unnamed protein product [Linum trigynum]|uniref:Uncharacterized protein n=1 Tax=Linum trigynum TaxID=586398 RepID=A0AAV2ERG9_9ROSI